MSNISNNLSHNNPLMQLKWVLQCHLINFQLTTIVNESLNPLKNRNWNASKWEVPKECFDVVNLKFTLKALKILFHCTGIYDCRLDNLKSSECTLIFFRFYGKAEQINLPSTALSIFLLAVLKIFIEFSLIAAVKHQRQNKFVHFIFPKNRGSHLSTEDCEPISALLFAMSPRTTLLGSAGLLTKGVTKMVLLVCSSHKALLWWGQPVSTCPLAFEWPPQWIQLQLQITWTWVAMGDCGWVGHSSNPAPSLSVVVPLGKTLNPQLRPKGLLVWQQPPIGCEWVNKRPL